MVLSAVGAALGLGAYLLRRIGPTIIAHAIFNGVVLIIVLTGANDRNDFEFDVDRVPRRDADRRITESTASCQTFLPQGLRKADGHRSR